MLNLISSLSIIPVPTGIRRPITTFSLKSSSVSTVPAIEADLTSSNKIAVGIVGEVFGGAGKKGYILCY